MSSQLQEKPHAHAPHSPDALLRADKLGMWASLACALHCAALPLLIALLPALGLSRAAVVDADQAFTIFATLLGLTTLTFGYRRHRIKSAWWLLLPGLALVWINTFTPLHGHGGAHFSMMVGGGLMIAAAHFTNTRLLRRAAAHCSFD